MKFKPDKNEGSRKIPAMKSREFHVPAGITSNATKSSYVPFCIDVLTYSHVTGLTREGRKVLCFKYVID